MGSLQQKPANPYRTTISPSSLYKGKCARCTWLSYWHNFSLPANLALQSNNARLQEGFFNNVHTSRIDPKLAPGAVKLYKGKRASVPWSINGEPTRWAFYGELDFVIEYEDGRFGVADGKVSMKVDEAGLIENYSTQLHAYAFMLENPKAEDGQKVDTLGLIQWRIDGTLPLESDPWGFKVDHRYIAVERDDAKFKEFMDRFVNVIEGEFPEPAADCQDCAWLIKAGFQY